MSVHFLGNHQPRWLKACLPGLFGLVSVIFAAPSQAEETVLTGSDAFQAMQKSTCTTMEPAVIRYGIFEGRSYSRVPGEADRHLFNVVGINVRQCQTFEDAKRGRGFRSVSREIMMYLDPETNEILETWKNPWTGAHIEVMHVANDPVSMRAARFEFPEEGEEPFELTVRNYGNKVASSFEIPLFYDNPLGGSYQKYVGGTYHAMEIFNSFYHGPAYLDPEVTSIGDSHLSWSRVAQWLPWMEMGSKPGLMIFNATGVNTLDKSKIPARLMTILEERYPEYLTPPPLDDARPNETSWTVFQKKLEQRAR